MFRPVATDVRGEKRFLSTIAHRPDTLGAITRGQRQTGGQGLFCAHDNLGENGAGRKSSLCCSVTNSWMSNGMDIGPTLGIQKGPV